MNNPPARARFAYQFRSLITFLLLAFAAASSPTKKLQEKSIAKLNELKLGRSPSTAA